MDTNEMNGLQAEEEERYMEYLEYLASKGFVTNPYNDD